MCILLLEAQEFQVLSRGFSSCFTRPIVGTEIYGKRCVHVHPAVSTLGSTRIPGVE